MLDCIDIARLYENVLIADKKDYKISDSAIKFGIECMAHVYKVGLLSTERPQIADFTDPAHRCAYLHKYAALHTAMVRDMMDEAIRANFGYFRQVLFSGERFNLCSLGGGPGTDVIGVLAALHTAFGFFDAAATVVDYMFEWSYSFSSILRELGTGWYGAFGNNVSYYLNWKYVQANLLRRTFQPEVLEALSTASLVTMIKFTSAAACQQTRYMIKNIFTAMKPGGLLLFIDNDGGGFYDLIKEAMMEYNFISIFGPFRRENYMNEFFSKKRFGYQSCFKTTVTVHILQKPLVFNPYYGVGLLDSYSNMYMPGNRRVLLEDNMVPKPLLGCSPPTPFLYLGQSPDENCNSLVPVRSPLRSRSSSQSFHHTPTHDFTQDVDEHEPYFVTSPEELPQSAGSHHSHEVDLRSRIATPLTSNIVNSPYGQRAVIYTPDSQPRRGKRPMQSCFPLRNFRHQLAKKIHNVKARARSVFKIKSKKKNHPIFDL